MTGSRINLLSPRIVYAAAGPRDYGRRPVLPYRRGAWEFQLVSRGRCRLTLSGWAHELAPAGTLWVFPPTFAHGWAGEPGRTCEVAVLHLTDVPEALVAWLGGRPCGRVALGTAAAAEVVRLAMEAAATWKEVAAVRGLRAAAAAARLSVLLLERDPGPVLSAGSLAERKVEQALAWVDAHLDEQPGVREAAAAVGVSAAHLRRLAKAIRGTSAREAIEDLRLRRARSLLGEPALKLEQVATASGYGSAAALVRAFRRATGTSPRKWIASR